MKRATAPTTAPTKTIVKRRKRREPIIAAIRNIRRQKAFWSMASCRSSANSLISSLEKLPSPSLSYFLASASTFSRYSFPRLVSIAIAVSEG